MAVDITNLGGVWRQRQIVGEDLDAIWQAVSPVQPETYFRKYLGFLRFLIDDDKAHVVGHEREAGVERFSGYDLRHICATVMLRFGMNQAEAVRRLGNSVPMLLAYYSGVMRGDEDAGNAILALEFG